MPLAQDRNAKTTGPKYGGKPCPKTKETRLYNPHCQGSWSDWSECDTEGRQRRTFTVTQEADKRYNGVACPSPLQQERICPIDCEGSWSDWTECKGEDKEVLNECNIKCPKWRCEKDEEWHIANNVQWTPATADNWAWCTGNATATQPETSKEKFGTACCAGAGEKSNKQHREFTVKKQANSTGKPCPSALREEQECPVDCEGYWTQWGACKSRWGNRQSRSWRTTKRPNSTGEQCPRPSTEYRDC